MKQWKEDTEQIWPTITDFMVDRMQTAITQIESSMADMFTDVVMNTKDLQAALNDFLKSITEALVRMFAEVIAKQIMLKAISFAVPGMMVAAQGGIVPGGFRAFAGGGIISRPTLGLVGEGRMNEAVVPLPNGRSIPVDLQGASEGDTFNITIQAIDTQTGLQFVHKHMEAIAAGIIAQKTRNHPIRRALG